MDNGYVNATHLCKQSEKKKLLPDWKRQESSKEILEDLASSMRIPMDELIKVPNGLPNELRGTYVHPHLVPVIAQWCSPKFRIRVAIILEDMAVREYKYKLAEANKHNFDLKYMMDKLVKQNEDIKSTNEEQTKKIDKLTEKNDTQTNIMNEQNNKIDKLTKQNDDQTRQIQELLGYAKDTKLTLNKTEAKLDIVVDATVQARDDLDIIHHKVDDIIETVVEHLVVPPNEAAKSTSFVLVQLDNTTFKCIRRQKQTIKTTIAKLKYEYKEARVVEEFAYPNSVSFLVRLKEYIKTHKIPLKARYQTITGKLEDVKRVVSELLDEQRQIDGVDEIKNGMDNLSDKLDSVV